MMGEFFRPNVVRLVEAHSRAKNDVLQHSPTYMNNICYYVKVLMIDVRNEVVNKWMKNKCVEFLVSMCCLC